MLDDVGSDYPWSGRDTGQLLGVHPQEFARVIKQITNLQLDASNRQSRPLLPSLFKVSTFIFRGLTKPARDRNGLKPVENRCLNSLLDFTPSSEVTTGLHRNIES